MDQQENYKEFDLLDEQILANIRSMDSGSICYESTVVVDQSQWKIWIELNNRQAEFGSVKLQITDYLWSDPFRHIIEVVVFNRTSKDDGYSERIIQKKRVAIEEIIREGITSSVAGKFSHSVGGSEKQVFTLSGASIPFGVIIRILSRRQIFDEPEVSIKKQRIETNKTLIVKGVYFPVNTHQLAICSPVFAAMFGSDMKEKSEAEIEINDVESSDHFAEFLRCLSPNERCLPNPANVLAICELANRFQVDSLLQKCERILQNCFEIPFVERFFFADKHSLKGLMDCIWNTMNSSKAKRFYFANKAALDTRLDLVVSLLTLICDEMLPRSVSLSSIRQQFINDQANYVEYDLLDEQIVASLQQITMVYSPEPIRYQSIACVDQSRWKVWIDVAKFTGQIRLNSVELQLIGYSWSDPSRYTIEFVVCTTNTDDNIYSERIFEKKRVDIDGEVIKIGTPFYGLKIGGKLQGYHSPSCSPLYSPYTEGTLTVKELCSALNCVEKQLFKIDGSLFPFRLIIRVLKRRQSFDGFNSGKQWIETDKTLIVKGVYFPVNTYHLAICSPVFAAMFGSDMKEKSETEIEIKDVESSDHFGEFLRCLSPNERCLPNPSNVLAICELASRFQVESLLQKCERILQNCFEIPFVERFFFADKHSLKGLMDHLLGSLDRHCLKRFYLTNKATLDTRLDLVVMLLTQMIRFDVIDKQMPKIPRSVS